MGSSVVAQNAFSSGINPEVQLEESLVKETLSAAGTDPTQGGSSPEDPNFGYESVLTNNVIIETYICGVLATCPEAGEAQSITAYLQITVAAHKVKCALYTSGGSFIQETEEKSIPVSTGWQTFNFITPKPSLSAGVSYIIVAWSESTDGYAYLKYGTVSGWTRKYKSGVTYPNYPASVTFSTGSNQAASIYCTYTPVAKFVPRSHHWRWYQNDNAEPITAPADEDTKPTGITSGVIARLRVCIHETGGAAGSDLDLQVEYSNDLSTWYPLGAQGATDKKWRWADGVATEHDTLAENKLSCTTELGKYHELACTDGVNVGENKHHEMDITIQDWGADGNTTYYFRILLEGEPVLPEGGFTYPQIETGPPIRGFEIDAPRMVIKGQVMDIDTYWGMKVIKITATSVEMTHGFTLTREFDGKKFEQKGIYGYMQNLVMLARTVDVCACLSDGSDGLPMHFYAETFRPGFLYNGDFWLYDAHIVAVYQSAPILSITNRLPPYNYYPMFVGTRDHPEWADPPHVAWWKLEQIPDGSPPATGPEVADSTPFGLADYHGIEALDGYRASTSNSPDTTKKPLHNFRFEIAEPLSEIETLTVSWVGYGGMGGEGAQLFIWNFTTKRWEKIGEHYATYYDYPISKTYTTGFSDYIQNGYLYLVALPVRLVGLTYINTNYVEVVLTSKLPALEIVVT